MSRRLYKLLRENQSIILYRLLKSFHRFSREKGTASDFDTLYYYCDSLLGGYLELLETGSHQRIEKFFLSTAEQWARLGFDIEETQKSFSLLWELCTPLLEKRYYHNPHIRARLKLDLESTLRKLFTLYSTIYNSVLVRPQREETRIFERVFKETADCIFSFDKDQRITIINPAMEKFLGITLDEVYGKKCCEVLKWKERQKVRRCQSGCEVLDAFRKGENSAYCEGLLEINRWKKRWVGTSASCVRDASGEIREIILIMRDVSHAKEVQRRLEEEIQTFETLADTTRGIDLKIPCLSEFVITARAQAELISRRMRFSPERIQDIKSAVGEACDNAIEHGSSPKGVDIRYRVRGTNLLIEIEDYGEGFDADEAGGSLPSPYVEGGRGLFLMKNLVDDLQIVSRKGQGTKVSMEIYRNPALMKRKKKEDRWKTQRKVCVM
ncbi:MAG: ATP-binding protein [Candidatus Eremiobacteraeota bacterium]|nr:ATP-binding protein [Candidatus Eremiobacteraeota bacterium]